MAKSTQQISQQLRHIVKVCGKTRYQISKETGIDESLLSRFVNGKCNISLNVIDKLAENLNLEIHMR